MSAHEKHICDFHRYERSKTNKTIYRCVEPDCRHYIARDKIEGKRALCYKCFEPFILTWAQLRNSRPVCEKCTKSPKAKQFKKSLEDAKNIVQDFPGLEKLFGEDKYENTNNNS